jgi:CubicO group peptidase (beta-lactamase class C family)
MRQILAGLLAMVSAAFALTAPALAAPLTAAQKARIDAIVAETLKTTGVPSASIAVVVDGKLDYARAYGDQRLDKTPPTLTARYAIASNSKQFTAAAILLLAEEGRLSLDDKVSKYLPELTRADEITVRQLLGHVSGIRDDWPQDYRFEAMTKPTTPQAIIDQWARAPLDFNPGAQYQYSNTGYTIAGVIFEMAAKEKLFAYEQRRIFKPLGMDVAIAGVDPGPGDAHGTLRYALGPVRPIDGEREGWMFAAGDLAMSPGEIARWDIARLNRTILKPESWAAQETNVSPATACSQYGLGLQLNLNRPHPRVGHGGAWTGFLTENRIFPKDRAAIAVFTNAGFSNAQGAIADAIEAVIFETPDDTAQARALFSMLREGRIDRSKFTANGNFYFSKLALADFATSLKPLGEPRSVARIGTHGLRGGFTSDRFVFTFKSRKMIATLRAEPDGGRIEQFTFDPAGD